MVGYFMSEIYRKILVVEDNKVFQAVLRKRLENDRTRLVFCDGMNEALGLLKETNGFNLIISDFYLPEDQTAINFWRELKFRYDKKETFNKYYQTFMIISSTYEEPLKEATSCCIPFQLKPDNQDQEWAHFLGKVESLLQMNDLQKDVRELTHDVTFLKEGTQSIIDTLDIMKTDLCKAQTCIYFQEKKDGDQQIVIKEESGTDILISLRSLIKNIKNDDLIQLMFRFIFKTIIWTSLASFFLAVIIGLLVFFIQPQEIKMFGITLKSPIEKIDPKTSKKEDKIEYKDSETF